MTGTAERRAAARVGAFACLLLFLTTILAAWSISP